MTIIKCFGVAAAVAVAAMGQQAAAQVTLPLEAEAPAWSKAAVAQEDGATMYQKAVASSPTLVFDFFNADEYEPTTYLPSWSNTVSRAHAEPRPLTGMVPVLSENAGWVEVDYVPEIEAKGYSYKVWVPAKSVTVTALAPLPADAEGLRVFGDGDLAGYGVYRNSGAEAPALYFGRMVGGKLVCAHTLGSDADVASLSADDVKALLATDKAVRPGQVMVVYATDGGAVGAQWWVKG